MAIELVFLTGGGFWNTVGIIFAMALVIAAAYFVTAFVGKRAGMMGGGRARHIRMVDHFAFSREKSIALMDIAGKTYLIGISNQEIRLLETLELAPSAMEEREVAPPFDEGVKGHIITGLARAFRPKKESAPRRFSDFLAQNDPGRARAAGYAEQAGLSQASGASGDRLDEIYEMIVKRKQGER